MSLIALALSFATAFERADQQQGVTFESLTPPPGATRITATALSDDGRVAYGYAVFGKKEGKVLPIRWAGGELDILSVPAGTRIAKGQPPLDTVDDGRWLVGIVETAKGNLPCRWNGGKPALLSAPAEFLHANGYAIATDGTVAGELIANPEERVFVLRACLWGRDGYRVLPMPEGATGTGARAISADGRTVVGIAWGGKSVPKLWTWSAGRLRSAPLGDENELRLVGVASDGRTWLVHRRSIAPNPNEDRALGRTSLVQGDGDETLLDPPGAAGQTYVWAELDASGTLALVEVHPAYPEPHRTYLRTPDRYIELRTLLRSYAGDERMIQVRKVARLSKDRAVVLGVTDKGTPFRAEIPL